LKRILSLAAGATAVAATVSLALTGGTSLAASAAGAAGVAGAAGAAQHAALPKITISMNGKKIAVGGALQSGGARIVSTVTGEPQGDPIFVRLNPGVTLGQFFALLHSPASNDPNNLNGVAAIVTDAQANRGTSTIQAYLAPGQYVAFDTVRNNPVNWPVTTFVIAKSAHPAKLPRPAATLAAIEFGFRGPGRLHRGELVRFANRGFLVHMLVYAVARNHAGAVKIARLLHAGKEGQAQRLSIGFGTFAGPLSHGSSQQLVIRNRPGWIVLACFMQTQDGRDHVLLGMERVIHIVK
jgi:hypothetical protein